MTDDCTLTGATPALRDGTGDAVLDRLIAEHACLGRLSSAMEARIEPLSRGGPVDYDPLLDTVVRLRELFVGTHAPKDADVVAGLLDGLTDQARGVLATTMTMDGIVFLDALDAFERGLNAALLGQVVSREALARSATKSARSLRAQIEREESALSPWARRRIASGRGLHRQRRPERVAGVEPSTGRARRRAVGRDGAATPAAAAPDKVVGMTGHVDGYAGAIRFDALRVAGEALAERCRHGDEAARSACARKVVRAVICPCASGERGIVEQVTEELLRIMAGTGNGE